MYISQLECGQNTQEATHKLMHGVCQSQFRSIWSHSTEAILILNQLKSAFFLVLVILVYCFVWLELV